MCMKTYCNQCGLTTWKGCGQHVAQVLRDVPIEERCRCQKTSSEVIDQTSKHNFSSYDIEI